LRRMLYREEKTDEKKAFVTLLRTLQDWEDWKC
jgi:hypothetical protein